ncbi:MAG: GNAT family N-acetyltransferase [Geodermatophilaceae bacterium]|nr:GNAT family N-acetyltransferase [Geodermatophilaceae bacterium]
MSDVRVERRNAPDAVERVLRGLPDWFGIDEAIRGYVGDAARLPSYLAVRDGSVAGIALLKRHFPLSAEVHLLAVQQNAHHQGIGSALLSAMEDDLSREGVQYLLVHTVGPSFDNPPYARTRAFYLARGFVALQELQRIDWDGPTLIMAKAIPVAIPSGRLAAAR